MALNCRHVWKQISDYIEGTVSAELREEIEPISPTAAIALPCLIPRAISWCWLPMIELSTYR